MLESVGFGARNNIQRPKRCDIMRRVWSEEVRVVSKFSRNVSVILTQPNEDPEENR